MKTIYLILTFVSISMVIFYGGYKLGYDKGNKITEIVEKIQEQLLQKVDDDPLVNITIHLAKLAAYEKANGNPDLYDNISIYISQLQLEKLH